VSEVEVSGSTVEDAVAQGLSELGATRDQVEVEILNEEPARVKLVLRPDTEQPGQNSDEGPVEVIAEPRREQAPTDPQEILEFGREDALDFLEGVLDAMELDGEVTVEVSEDSLQARVDGEDLGVLIGRHGRTLDALQELMRAAVQHQGNARIRMTLDIEGYRERRREAVAEIAREVAEQALEEGEARMEPMPAFERKVVHDTVAQIEGVVSESEGEDPDRYVVVRQIDGE
jgi:spoIIIJ-associated protein